MNAKRIRKALVAGGAAGVAVVFTGMTTDTPNDEGEWAALIAKAVGAALVTGYATWRVRNAPATTTAPRPEPYQTREGHY